MPYKDLITQKIKQKEYYLKNREYILERQRYYEKYKRDKVKRRSISLASYYKHRDRISLERKLKTIAKRKIGFCEICFKECQLFYDHCHITNKFRGWLCRQCNIALGMVKDKKEILCQMIKYLDTKTMA